MCIIIKAKLMKIKLTAKRIYLSIIFGFSFLVRNKRINILFYINNYWIITVILNIFKHNLILHLVVIYENEQMPSAVLDLKIKENIFKINYV